MPRSAIILYAILRKLGVHSQRQAVKVALEQHLV
jgi:hypothetical protein